MAYILHIDTSGESCLTALALDGKVLSVAANSDSRNHAEVINHHIDNLLADNGITLKDLSALCVCGGPGSYTGLRIGLATAKGFCYALGKPLMMHSKLLLMALPHIYQSPDTQFFIPILLARQEEYFAAIYSPDFEIIKEPQHVLETDFDSFSADVNGATLTVGYIDDNIKNRLKQDNTVFDVGTVVKIDAWARYAYQQYNGNGFVNLANSEPFYLKQVYTHTKKNIN